MQCHVQYRLSSGLGTSRLLRKRSIRQPKYRYSVCHATGASAGPLEDFGRKARETVGNLAGTAQKSATAFWKNNRVPERLKETYATVDDNVRRTAAQLDSKYDVTGKAKQAASQVSQQAQVVDSRIGFKRRLRNLADDVQRKAPLLRKQIAAFQKTTLGQICFTLFVFALFYTGIAFRILNLLFILWWIAPLLMLPFSGYINRKARAEAAKREAEAQSRAARNPFFRGSSFFRQRPPGTQQPQPRKYNDSDAPIIDVSYESLD